MDPIQLQAIAGPGIVALEAASPGGSIRQAVTIPADRIEDVCLMLRAEAAKARVLAERPPAAAPAPTNGKQLRRAPTFEAEEAGPPFPED